MKLILLLLLLAIPGAESLGQCSGRPPVIFFIAKKEGYYKKGTLPARLHNPGSLWFCHQRGAKLGPRGFARFANDKAGWSALERDVVAKTVRHIPLKKGWDYL